MHQKRYCLKTKYVLMIKCLKLKPSKVVPLDFRASIEMDVSDKRTMYMCIFFKLFYKQRCKFKILTKRIGHT